MVKYVVKEIFFFYFAHLSHAILREICIYKIVVERTSDSYGRRYVRFAHYLLYYVMLYCSYF